MRTLVAIAGLSLIFIVLWDAFETVVLPRRVTRKFRLARYFYRATWRPWARIAGRLRNEKRREAYLSYFGPLSLLLLLSTWALGLVVSFALLHRAARGPVQAIDEVPGFGGDLYFSGTTFFTLGIGDVLPQTPLDRAVTVAEAGVGLGFLAIVIGYLPVIYQAFSRREVNISLLDARAGSPPTAAGLLRRHSQDHGLEALQQLLHEWEHWSAELMESHLSYPVLAYFRSQHNNQSWLGALTAILDTSALVMAGVKGACKRQAELTFAIARHAVVDLAQVFGSPPTSAANDRLPSGELLRLRMYLEDAGLRLPEGIAVDEKLTELRRMYEPYVQSLSRHLRIELPPWITEHRRADNWQTSAWEKTAGRSGNESTELKVSADDEHY